MNRFTFDAWTTPQGDDELCPHHATVYIANSPFPCTVIKADLNDCQVHFETLNGLVVFVAIGDHASITNVKTGSTKSFKYWDVMKVGKYLREQWGTTGKHQPTYAERKQSTKQALANTAKGLFSKLLRR